MGVRAAPVASQAQAGQVQREVQAERVVLEEHQVLLVHLEKVQVVVVVVLVVVLVVVVFCYFVF